ncbi:related to TAM domain methyltransferase [Rhynchosporium graminicola]|uniref:Related to TAM domain methyltransferase n=1 Tax=Rhynchosporium graminicola TaxID=2792576 RepID=A0A1E1JQU6_9HELO|nr:related to TAM domain methyltransferase [Rhynchosporium commune]
MSAPDIISTAAAIEDAIEDAAQVPSTDRATAEPSLPLPTGVEEAPTPALPLAVPVLGPVQADVPAGAIEADEDEALDNDSAFGDDVSEASSRTSLSSGIKRYRVENGRRYHAYKEGNYLLPNDETEQDRLDLHHHIFNLVAEGRLFYAPVENPSRVLDAGTGTGIWAIDFADQFPSAHVVGTDLSPIQPGWVPPNLEFEVDDMEDVWRHKPFSFIHLRCLAGSLKDWPHLLEQAYENLEPGGWLEIVDFEMYVRDQRAPDADAPGMPDLSEGKSINMWVRGLHQAAETIGRTFVPLGPWAKNRRQKEIGLYQQQNMLDASSAYGAAHFTRVLEWSSEEFQVLSAGVRNEMKDKTAQLYSNLYVVYGRKPGSGKDELEAEVED